MKIKDLLTSAASVFMPRNCSVCGNPLALDEHFICRKCLMNTASAGKFSSDRSIQQYADEIWHIKPIENIDAKLPF